MLRAIMDISARAISLTDRPQWAIWVTSVRMRREDRTPSRLILSQTSAGKVFRSGYVIAGSSFYAVSVAVGVELESSGLVRCLIHLPRLEVPTMGQY